MPWTLAILLYGYASFYDGCHQRSSKSIITFSCKNPIGVGDFLPSCHNWSEIICSLFRCCKPQKEKIKNCQQKGKIPGFSKQNKTSQNEKKVCDAGNDNTDESSQSGSATPLQHNPKKLPSIKSLKREQIKDSQSQMKKSGNRQIQSP